MLKVLYEDQELLVAVKPAGMESQAARRFEPDMVSAIRNHLVMNKSCTPGQAPYVGVIHRLDKPVSGVMVYAKTKNAAAALSSQPCRLPMRLSTSRRKPSSLSFVDYLKKSVDGNYSQVVDKGITGAKRAELTLEALRFLEEGPNGGPLTLLRIQLETGRHHQIRVQLAAHGMPVYGDARYGRGEKGPLALCAVSLSFLHPRTKKKMEFHMEPSDGAFAWMKER